MATLSKTIATKFFKEETIGHKNLRWSNNAKLIEKYSFPVQMYKADEYAAKFGGIQNFNSDFSKFIVANPETNPKLVGVHGSSYNLVPNSQILGEISEKLNESFGKNAWYLKAKSLDSRQFEFTFVVDKYSQSVTEKDQLNMTIIVRNSYDGIIKLSQSIGTYRLVCENGLMAFDLECGMDSKHTDSYNFNIDLIERRMSQKMEQLNKFKQLSDRTLTQTELEELQERFSVLSPQMPKKLVQEAFLSTIENECLALEVKPNLWIAYNAANAIIGSLEKASHTPAFLQKLDKQNLELVLEYMPVN